MSAAEHAALIDAEEARDRIEHGEAAALEVGGDDPSGYAEAHPPGTPWAHWKDLLWHPTDRRLAAPGLLRRRLDALGIDASRLLVVYGDPLQMGTYAYWVLRAQGLDQPVAVLDGGAAGWRARGLPTEADDRGAEERAAASRVLRWLSHEPDPVAPPADCLVGRDEVLAAIDDRATAIVDARSRAEFRGERVSPEHREVDHGAERAGRIPGARHLPYERFLDDDGAFASPDEVRRVAEDAGLRDAERVITYCRLSHRASLAWFALSEVLGRDGVAVYDGSWTEWGSIVGMPIER